MEQLKLNVLYVAKEGCREKFVEEILKSGVLELIRGEDGCLAYDYYCGVEKKNEILLYECWESREKQQVHLTQPHMDIVKNLKPLYIEETRFL